MRALLLVALMAAPCFAGSADAPVSVQLAPGTVCMPGDQAIADDKRLQSAEAERDELRKSAQPAVLPFVAVAVLALGAGIGLGFAIRAATK